MKSLQKICCTTPETKGNVETAKDNASGGWYLEISYARSIVALIVETIL
jgi:hypothetical protein